jgi:hypothetical protein
LFAFVPAGKKGHRSTEETTQCHPNHERNHCRLPHRRNLRLRGAGSKEEVMKDELAASCLLNKDKDGVAGLSIK